MREVVYKNPIDALVYKIFGLFQILRESGRFDSSEESLQLVLYFISIYKDGLVSSNSLDNLDSFKEFHSTLGSLPIKQEVNSKYRDIVKVLDSSLSKIEFNTLYRFFNSFSEIDRSNLKNNFAEVFDEILYRFSQSQGRYAGEFIQPVELTRFMSGLVDTRKNLSVFNPFAGLASFGVFLDKGQSYFGQELNQKTWALGALRLLAYNRFENTRFECDDSIMNWPESSEKFDLVISNPPYGMKIDRDFMDKESRVKTIEHFLIDKGVSLLNQNGKLIALLPQGFLFRETQEQELRAKLIEDDIIETIISLPGGLLLNTGIPLVILVLNKSKKIAGKVKFIDATQFVIAKGPREKVLDHNNLNSFINSETLDENVIRIIDNQQIRDCNYNLSVARYFQKKIDGVKLGDILELVSGQIKSLPKSGKLIRPRDLKEDKIDFKIDASNIEVTDLGRTGVQLLAESCLLLAIRSKTLRPTYFEVTDETVFKTQDILAFKINESLVETAYLVNELQADYVQEQLDGCRTGISAMPFIRKEDLMEVIVKLPSLKEQRERVQSVFNDKINDLKAELNALTQGSSIHQFNEFASLKHTLGRPRQNILDWSDNLLDFLNKNRENIVKLNESFLQYYDVDIISVLHEIKRDVNFITDVLEKGENGLVLSEYEQHFISLFEINSIIEEKLDNGFNFKIKKLLLEGENLKEKGINANKTLLKILLDNIYTNANKYAFDNDSVGNEVVVELKEIEELLTLEIKNNGKPFPENFDKEKFIAKYSTADTARGSGLGGYDINRIAVEFNNPDWKLSLNEDPFYSVKFQFQFPIKHIN